MWLRLSVLVLLIVRITSYSDKMPCFLQNGTISSYDVISEICCNRTISPLVQGGNIQHCCGGTRLYSQSQDTCCGLHLVSNEKVKKLYGDNSICCGGEFHNTDDGKVGCCEPSDGQGGRRYNPGSHKCCEGELHYRPPTGNVECCGTNLIDANSQTCEKDGTLVPQTYMSVCKGDHEYDVNTHVCCRDTGKTIERPSISLLEVPPYYACFNDTLYDKKKFKIERGVKIPIDAELCGDELYFNDKGGSLRHICCGDTLKTIDTKQDARPRCCGKELYDMNLKTCHGGRLLPYGYDVCNSEPFHTGSKECCNGVLIDRKTHLCCGRVSFMMKPVHKQAANHTSCCKHFITYNEFDMVCDARGVIVPVQQPPTPAPVTTSSNPQPAGQLATSSDGHVNTTSDVKKTNGMEIANAIRKEIVRIQCPREKFCNPVDLPPSCRTRSDITIFTYEIKPTLTGTKIKAVVMEGSLKQGLKVVIRMKARCPCVRNHRFFRLYTNRRLHAKRSIRVTSQDYFVQESSPLTCARKHLNRRGSRG